MGILKYKSLSDKFVHVNLVDNFNRTVLLNHPIHSNAMNNTSLQQITHDIGTNELHCGTGDLMGPLGLFVQGLLAFLAFTSLIVKRYCEPKHSRRPWKIWFFDTSKQALGAAVIHFANVFLADKFQGDRNDPCTWYFISFLLDSTVGLLVIYIGLKVTQIIARRKQWTSLYFGVYGDPPNCTSWIGQCLLYLLVVLVEKFLMTLLVQFRFWTDVRNFIMSPVTEPQVELVIVMFLVPLVVNAFIFWVVDNFLKRSIQSAKTIYVNTDEASVKFYKSSERVKCYNRIEKTEESDVFMSADEDVEIRQRSNDVSDRLLQP